MLFCCLSLGKFYKLVLSTLSIGILLGRFINLFGLFLFIALKRSPLRSCGDKNKNPQKDFANESNENYFQIAECS